MAKIYQKEKVLMDCSSPDDEVDFSDVFGGPPRRFPIQDFHSEGDYNYDSENGVEDDRIRVRSSSSSSWFGEKPVFGDEPGGRRRHASDDFYDDIFKGDQPSSCSQSPRALPLRDPFSSAPGSRVMSPTRPAAEPFGSPSKFSLPARLASSDFVTAHSPSHSRFNQNNQNLEAHRGDSRSSYRPSPLSHQNSTDGKQSTSSSKSVGSTDRSNSTKDSRGSEAPNDIAQFHFSIYKWANKGVPLVMSLRKKSSPKSKAENKAGRRLIPSQRVGSNVLVTENYKVDVSFNDGGVEVSQSTSEDSPQNVEVQIHRNDVFHGLDDPIEVPVRSRRSSDAPPQNTMRSNLSSLRSFLQEGKQDEEVTPGKGSKQGKASEKERPSSKDGVSSRKADKAKAEKGSVREAKDDTRKKEGAGKVKEFVRAFNPDPVAKSTRNVQGQGQSRRWKDTTTSEAIGEAKSTAAKAYEEVRASSVNWDETWFDASEVVDEHSSLSGKQQPVDSNSFARASGASFAASANVSDSTKDSTTNVSPPPQSSVQMKDVRQDVNVQPEAEKQEDTESYEIKIRQWSRGKEGNIRALLSTLQSVLWPNSGWKPVPLVDIIEANAVKRSYQKALLCLHPDKLQQKGAAPHHKFIAHKVFDILQEAWDHFNSLGHL